MSFIHKDIPLRGEQFTRQFKEGRVGQYSVLYVDGSSTELSNTDDINMDKRILKDQR